MLESGFEIIDNFFSEMDIQHLENELDKFNLEARKGGVRNIEKKSACVLSFCKSKDVLALAGRYLRPKPALIRAIYFNKTQQNNWLVSWHQDKTVTVSQRFKADGWGPWSIKDNAIHVQPPLEVLEQMVTLRIHLDAATSENGCLKVIPGSHAQGILEQEQISALACSSSFVNCVASKGAVLVMRPHILHASSKATEPTTRRVLHLEYSSYLLPDGVSWA